MIAKLPAPIPRLREFAPALLAILCAIAGRHVSTQPSDLHQSLWNKAISLLQAVSFSAQPSSLSESSSWDVLALSLAAMYQPQARDTQGYGHTRATISYMLVGHAVRLAQALDLFRRSSSAASRAAPLARGEEEATRHALVLFSVDKVFSVALRRPLAVPLTKSVYALRDALAHSPELQRTDAVIIAIFDLSCIFNNVSLYLDDGVEDSEATYQLINQFENDIHQWYTAIQHSAKVRMADHSLGILMLHKQHALVSLFVRHVPVSPFSHWSSNHVWPTGKSSLAPCPTIFEVYNARLASTSHPLFKSSSKLL